MKTMKTFRTAIAVAGMACATFAVTSPAGAQIRNDAFHGPFDTYRFAGEDYCWYDNAWNGPGWYLCDTQWRRGFGWGGYYGWHGWYPRHHHHHHHHPRGPRPGPRPDPRPGRPPA